ncbi:MAG: DUF3467 domain-containing protein [Phycisphaerales bacterium]
MSADQATPGNPPAGQQIRLNVDERQMHTSYANGFRTHSTVEEVIMDFGLNMAAQSRPAQQDDAAGAAVNEINFQVNDRIILNYYTAKRLALSLGQVIRRHEEQFGELKLNVPDRLRK